MRIGLDASYSIDRQPSGVGIYSQNLIAELAALDTEHRWTLCYRANRFFRSLTLPQLGPKCGRALMESPTLPLLTARFDLFHGLNQRLPERRFRRAVTTFHDLFVMTSTYSTADYRAKFERLAREAAERSDRIIAVSTFTADQTTDLLGFPREQISVVPHGVDPVPDFSADELASFRIHHGLERPFLLNVGTVQERKNISRIVEAFETLSDNVLLVLAGGEGYGIEKIKARIAASPARDRIVQMGYVDVETKAKLYRTAHVLAFPSLDEGFGIPILEAMSAGLPVLTSDCSSMPEVAGDAAVLVAPTDTTAIADGLSRLVEDTDLRDTLRAQGIERAKQFTWKRAAQSVLAVYEELA